MINNEKFYSTEEVSEILNVKKATIRSWYEVKYLKGFCKMGLNHLQQKNKAHTVQKRTMQARITFVLKTGFCLYYRCN